MTCICCGIRVKRAGEELSPLFTDGFSMRQPLLSHVSADDGSVKEYSCMGSNCPRTRTRRAARDTETLSYGTGVCHTLCSWLYAMPPTPFKVPSRIIRLILEFGYNRDSTG